MYCLKKDASQPLANRPKKFTKIVTYIQDLLTFSLWTEKFRPVVILHTFVSMGPN